MISRQRRFYIVTEPMVPETPEDEVEDDSAEVITADDPAWLTYEKDVTSVLISKDDNATVKHNQKVTGKSGRPRQLDALIKGTICGEEIVIAVEAKKYNKPVGIGVVDAFVGKCLDTGADKGVLYSEKGFGKGAIARAAAADHPKIRLRVLPDPDAVEDVELQMPPWEDLLPDFLDLGECPGEGCWGDIRINTEHGWDGGVCDQCAIPAGLCRSCESVSQLLNDEQKCDWCDHGTFEVEREYNSQEVTFIRWEANWDHPN